MTDEPIDEVLALLQQRLSPLLQRLDPNAAAPQPELVQRAPTTLAEAAKAVHVERVDEPTQAARADTQPETSPPEPAMSGAVRSARAPVFSPSALRLRAAVRERAPARAVAGGSPLLAAAPTTSKPVVPPAATRTTPLRAQGVMAPDVLASEQLPAPAKPAPARERERPRQPTPAPLPPTAARTRGPAIVTSAAQRPRTQAHATPESRPAPAHQHGPEPTRARQTAQVRTLADEPHAEPAPASALPLRSAAPLRALRPQTEFEPQLTAASAPAPATDLGSLDELEECLADVLEQCLLESGIDLA